jgi:hypothetical protein
MNLEVSNEAGMVHNIRHAQALAYVWGRRDAGDERVGSVEFASAYTEYKHNGGTSPLQDAYKVFVRTGGIT